MAVRGHEELERWAGSGALALTGPPDGRPLGPPRGLVPRLDALTASLAQRSAATGTRVQIGGLDVLTERAALAGLGRGGRTSCGGATRLLATVDGWIAVALARDDDLDLIPAWLGTDPVDALDFTDEADRERLRGLVRRADVVVEATRPRALSQLGLDARATVRGHDPRIWLSITGHGRTPATAHRVGFGDDAAVAGGLVARAADGPCFCLDAVADPLTGLTAADTDAVLGDLGVVA